MTYTWIDYIIIIIFIINIVLGLARGLLRELISMISLIIALVVTIKFTIPVTEILNGSNGFKDVVLAFSSFTDWNAIGPLSFVSLGVSFILIFTLVFSLCEAANYYAANFVVVLFPGFAILDRLIAGFMGFIRGYVLNLILILELGMTPVYGSAPWTDSYFIPALTANASALGAMVRPGGFPVWTSTS